MINKQTIDLQQWSELVKQNLVFVGNKEKRNMNMKNMSLKTSEIPQEVEMVNVEATQVL